MTFQDIFKSSFLENIASISLLDMVIALFLAFLLGLFIFFIYKKSYSGVMYSASFGVTLIALSLITTLLIMTVVSNIVLSLGMVGALSIVRFRTAIKEPMDIAFLFWAIAVGIVLAAGLIPLAVFGSIFIGVVLFAIALKKGMKMRRSPKGLFPKLMMPMELSISRFELSMQPIGLLWLILRTARNGVINMFHSPIMLVRV